MGACPQDLPLWPDRHKIFRPMKPCVWRAGQHHPNNFQFSVFFLSDGNNSSILNDHCGVLMLYTAAFLLVHIGAFYITGTWRHWKEYYPTVLFAIVGDFSYNILFNERFLWMYNTLFDHRIADMVYAFFVFPCATIMFLRYYPKGILKEGLYILLWTAAYTVIEAISCQIDNFCHYGGWNIFWSAGLYFFAFILIRIHHKKPLVVWPIGLAFAIAMLFIFQQPFHFSVTQ